jgi:peptidoglycan hydrolase CwlO-like protein
MALIEIDDSVLIAKDAQIDALTGQISALNKDVNRLNNLLNRATNKLAKFTPSGKLEPEQGDGNNALTLKLVTAQAKLDQYKKQADKASVEQAEVQATIDALVAAGAVAP